MKIIKPIFICGHIKTGTSLMASLLDSHEQLNVFPEELFLFSKYSQFRKNNLKSYDDYWFIFFEDIQVKKMFGNKAQGLFGNVDYSNFDAYSFKKICVEYTKTKDPNSKFLQHVFEAVFFAFNKINKLNSSNRFVEKTPMNEFNFFYWIKAYPYAQFIYMKRDPFEVYSSVKKKRSLEKNHYSIYNFIVNYLISVKLATYLQKYYPDNFKIIELIELKNQTQETMTEIENFLDIKTSALLLKPTKLGKVWKGNSMFSGNNTPSIENKSYNGERDKITTKTEKKFIYNYIIKSKKPLLDLNFIRNDFKNYLKVIFSNYWLKQFIRKKSKLILLVIIFNLIPLF
jgi:hypothetical protein